MAYSYSYHNDTYQPTRHEAYLNRPASRDPHGYSRHSANEQNPHSSKSTPMTASSSRNGRYDYDHNRSYDPRTSYREQNLPPPPSPRPQESAFVVIDRRRARSVNQRTWPPQPTAEDEALSLAKEYPRPRLHSHSDEVCMRGTVDQDPILIELDNGERRFVLIPSQEEKSLRQDESRHTVKKSARESRQKDGPPVLKLDVDETNIFTRRQPSPYAFTRTPKTPTNRISSEYSKSPDVVTPPTSSSLKHALQKETVEPTNQQNHFSGPSGIPSRYEPSGDSDLDSLHAAELRSRRPKPRASFHEAGHSTSKRYSSDLSDREELRLAQTQSPYEGDRSEPTDIPRTVLQNSTRIADESSSAASRVEPKPTLKLHRSGSVYTSRPSRNEFVRPTSPLGDAIFHLTPPGSPGLAPGGNVTSNRRSVSKPVSRTTSRPSSRPSSPSVSTLDLNQAYSLLSRSLTSDVDRSSTYPPSTQERAARPTSKLSSSTRQESVETLKAPLRIDIQSPSPIRPVTGPPLPYPDDRPDVLMPSHEKFQVRPDGLATSFEPRYTSRSPSATTTSTSTTASWTAPLRPFLSSRHMSLNEDVPRSRPEPARTATYESTSRNQSPTTSEAVLPRLPPCPRKSYSRKYDDWYTLEDESSFDICPNCLDEIVRPSAFRKYFKRAAPRAASVRTRCDFGSPWVRLAWLLTLKRQRQDLDLIYALAAISNIEPECPSGHESNGPWYGIRDQTGEFIPNFTICSCDLRNLEALFPSLLGVFTRLPQTSSMRTASVCSLHTDSRRFAIYLDLISTIDDKARAFSRASIPDLTSLYELLRSHAYKLECPRDRIVLAQTWHFMPSLPDFTICEECYDDAVWPCIKAGSDLASSFNRVLMPVPPSTTRKLEGGASCQLYSARMRKIWERVVRYDDDEGFRYLARKVRERKDVEEDLRLQQVDLKRLLDRGSGVDKERLRRELERIEKEWAEWE